MGAIEKLQALADKIRTIEKDKVTIGVDSSSLDKLYKAITKLTSDISELFKNTSSASQAELNNMWKTIAASANRLSPVFEELKDTGVTAFVELADEAKNTLSSLDNYSTAPLMQEFDSLKTTVGDTFSDLSGVIKSALKEGINEAKQEIDNIAIALRSLENIDLSGFSKKFVEMMQAVAEQSIRAVDSISDRLDALNGKTVTVTVKVVENKG